MSKPKPVPGRPGEFWVDGVKIRWQPGREENYYDTVRIPTTLLHTRFAHISVSAHPGKTTDCIQHLELNFNVRFLRWTKTFRLTVIADLPKVKVATAAHVSEANKRLADDNAELRAILEAMSPFFHPDISRGPADDSWVAAAKLLLPELIDPDEVRWLIEMIRIGEGGKRDDAIERERDPADEPGTEENEDADGE